MKTWSFLGCLAFFLLMIPPSWGAEISSLSIQRDKETETYTVSENGLPVLSYHFGEVPYPKGLEVKHFHKKATNYDGAYYTDGSVFGGPRSDYVQPLYGFNGEPLTDDFPEDHPHHRGFWWSWCEVRWNDQIGDIWAVSKIRAYPEKLEKAEIDDDYAEIEAVNLWRFDNNKTPVVEEKIELKISKTTGAPGARVRTIDMELELTALVDGIAIAGRQKVDYGGYGGLAVRMVPRAEDFSVRAVHPKPDTWRGSDNKMAEVISDPATWGDASWLSIFGRYPLSASSDSKISDSFTSLTLYESAQNPLAPNNFRYYTSRNIMIAFPAFNIVPLPKGKTVEYKMRLLIREGKSDPATEFKAWQEYQKSL